MSYELPVLIRRISQKDNYSFAIEWSDGSVNEYRLRILQQNCPCAGCKTIQGKPAGEHFHQHEVKAVKISSVGRYALRIQYTHGCSKGIYSFAMLREMAVKDR